MKGMEYKDRSGDMNTLEQLIDETGWVFQQKMDGTRALVNLETLQFSQRNGNPLKHSAATQWISWLLQEMSDLGLSGMANTILDCELMIGDGELYVFDVIDPSNLVQPLFKRLERLEALPTGRTIQKVYTAWTPEEKRELWEACKRTEGIVAKDVFAPYEAGIRTDQVLKFKNIHTANMVVTKLSDSPKSAGLGVISGDGQPATVAYASMIGKDQTLEVGDVVEVNYLSWTGVSLIQPRIVGRSQKDPMDCTFQQFKPYTKEALR